MKHRPLAGPLLATLVVTSSLLAAGCEGRPHAGTTTDAKATEPTRKTGPAIAILDISGGVPEHEAASLFGGIGRKRSFDELLNAIAEVGTNKGIVGVVVKFGSASIGAARSQEIGEHLEKLKEKKKVYCHGDAFSNATIMLAARGCSSIYVSPAGGVETVGLAAQLLYMRRLLVDELHLSIDMLQVGKFKGAEEPLTRDGPSPEARASLTGVLVDFRTAWMNTITEARPRPGMAETIEDGPYSPLRAKDVGLVGRRCWMVRQAERHRDLHRRRHPLARQVEPPGGQARHVELGAAAHAQLFLHGVDRRRRAGLPVELGARVGDHVVIDALRRLGCEHHAEAVLAPLRREPDQALFAGGRALRGHEVLCFIENEQAA